MSNSMPKGKDYYYYYYYLVLLFIIFEGYFVQVDKWYHLFFVQIFRPTQCSWYIHSKRWLSQWPYIPIRVVLRRESNNLANVLRKPNQKSNGLSMKRKCGQRLATDDRRTFMKVLGADKDVSWRQTLGNNNNDAMFDCKNGFIIVLLTVLFDIVQTTLIKKLKWLADKIETTVHCPT